MGLYRAFRKVSIWCGRVITSTVAGLMAALLLLLGGGKLLGGSDLVMMFLIVLALPLWIIVSVYSYKALKPTLQDRE
jgi:hypothetical protein